MANSIQIKVNASLLDNLKAHIAKVAKAAAKLGLLPVPVAEEGETETRLYNRTRTEENFYYSGPYATEEEAGKHRGTTVAIPFVNVTVRNLGSPRIEGWEFAAIIEHHAIDGEYRNIVHAAPDYFNAQLTNIYGSVPPLCDHCKLDRRRNDTYIVFNTETHEYAQVGRTCLQDFTGHADPAAIAAYFNNLVSLYNTVGHGSELHDPELQSTVYYPTTRRFLATTAAAIREHGWVSKGDAYEEPWRVATAERVQVWLGDTVQGQPLEADFELADTVLAWLEDLDPQGNDYLSNVKNACAFGYVTERQAGLVASAIRAYERAQEALRRAQEAEERKAEAEALTPYVGQRITVQGVIVKGTWKEDYYRGGSVYKITVQDDRGFLVWGTAPQSLFEDDGRPTCEPQNGTRVRFDAKIKGVSDRDDTFGFFNRPTKAELLECAS